MSEKLRVGVIGATGMVGQRYISLLEDHPWFDVTCVASESEKCGQNLCRSSQGTLAHG